MNDDLLTEIKLYFLAAVALAALFAVFVWSSDRGVDHAPIQTENNPLPENYRPTEFSASLQNAADELLPLFDGMDPIPVRLIDQPVIPGGTNVERGVAFTTCERRTEPSIFVKREFYEKANSRQLVNILKHELTHAYFCRRGIGAGHDESFRQKFSAVGGFGN